MSVVKFKYGLSTSLDSLPVEDGSLIVTTDNKQIYLDVDSNRIKLGGNDMTAKLAASYGVSISAKSSTKNYHPFTTYSYLEIIEQHYEYDSSTFGEHRIQICKNGNGYIGEWGTITDSSAYVTIKNSYNAEMKVTINYYIYE